MKAERKITFKEGMLATSYDATITQVQQSEAEACEILGGGLLTPICKTTL